MRSKPRRSLASRFTAGACSPTPGTSNASPAALTVCLLGASESIAPIVPRRSNLLSPALTVVAPEQFDFIVFGSGFGGSITSMLLRRLGYSVLLVERGAHPRFVIGESS